MKKILIFIIFFILGFSFFGIYKTQAQEIESVNDHITVTPAKFEIWGDQGQMVTQALRLTNEDNEPVILALSVEKLETSGESGIVVMPQGDPRATNDLPKWIMFKQNGLEFKAKETRVITFNIDVPKEAKSGGHYATIIISSEHLNKKVGESSGSTKVASIVLLSVVGDIVDEAKISTFTIKRETGNKNFDLNLRMKNTGNNHIKPEGTIVVTNLMGTQIDEIPLEGETILPNMTKKMVTAWDPQRFLFGRYSATIVLKYGFDNKQTLTTSSSFWVINWYLIFLILLLLGSLVYYLRKYRKSILLAIKNFPKYVRKAK